MDDPPWDHSVFSKNREYHRGAPEGDGAMRRATAEIRKALKLIASLRWPKRWTTGSD
jgi:hypothetical protein